MNNDDIISISQQEIDSIQKKNNIEPIRQYPSIDNFRPIPFDELERIIPPPLEYIFYPCLPTQGIAFIYAATGLGKTLFALNMAYAIAGGGNFLKYTCPKPRKVLYVDAEMAFNQVHSRLMQIAERQGELDFKENLCLLTPDKILPFRMPKIDEEEGQHLYKELMLAHNFEVIVLDNLSMLSSIDENKSSEWKIVQDWLLHLRALGKTIILIHHAGKDKNGYRGTSRMLDCVDTAISLQSVNDENMEDDNLSAKKFKVVYQKARLFGGKDALSYEVTLDNSFWSYRSIELSVLDKVIENLNAGLKQREIAKELFISQSTVNRLIKKARLTGRVKD
jgi:RecA-family ATPase